jgi:hypothetical protein
LAIEEAAVDSTYISFFEEDKTSKEITKKTYECIKHKLIEAKKNRIQQLKIEYYKKDNDALYYCIQCDVITTL